MKAAILIVGVLFLSGCNEDFYAWRDACIRKGGHVVRIFSNDAFSTSWECFRLDVIDPSVK